MSDHKSELWRMFLQLVLLVGNDLQVVERKDPKYYGIERPDVECSILKDKFMWFAYLHANEDLKEKMNNLIDYAVSVRNTASYYQDGEKIQCTKTQPARCLKKEDFINELYMDLVAQYGD